MNLETVLINSLWAALFAAAMTVIFSAPLWALAPSFLSGFGARFVRDVLIGAGVGPNLAILIAATLAVSLSVGLIRRRAVAPVIVVSGLIPLGAATAFLRGVVGLLKMSSLEGVALSEASVLVMSNFAIGFNTTLVIAMGFWLGIALVGLLGKKWATC
jgi:uncharacterized membrane protein YjjB (DUF3815 family)